MSLFTGPMHRHLDGHKDLTLTAEVCRSIDPEIVYIPLVNGNAKCEPCVKVGDDVKVGTKVAERNDHFYLPLFSSVSGTVTGIEKRMTSGLTPADHLVIQNDHKYEKECPFKPLDYEKASWEELHEFCKNAGMLGLGGAGFPTYVKYAKPENVDLLIINAVECEPYLTADYKNIEENMDLLKTGVLAFGKLGKAAKTCVAIKENKTAQIAALKEAFAGTGVEIRTVKDLYPMGWERTIVQTLTGRTYEHLPIEAGCIVSNAGTAIAFGNALTNGMPITNRYVTVSGDGISKPQNVYVPVGTTAHDIVDACGGYTAEDVYLIAGGPMMGKTITKDEFSIAPQNNGITVLVNRPVDETPCLRCGRCTECCPAGLEPVRIANAVKINDTAALAKLHTLDCVECGLCTYVCPSKISVTENVRKGKRALQMRMNKGGAK